MRRSRAATPRQHTALGREFQILSPVCALRRLCTELLQRLWTSTWIPWLQMSRSSSRQPVTEFSRQAHLLRQRVQGASYRPRTTVGTLWRSAKTTLGRARQGHARLPRRLYLRAAVCPPCNSVVAALSAAPSDVSRRCSEESVARCMLLAPTRPVVLTSGSCPTSRARDPGMHRPHPHATSLNPSLQPTCK